MPKATPIYNSFNSGALSDLIRGRSDLEQYYRGGLEYLNLMALQYGPFCNRPGSMYQANVKVDAEISRLLEFVFNRSDAFLIEMGVLYFRFYASTGQVSGPLEVVHTYTAAELFDVQYAQSNDVITLVHPEHKPAKLTRVSASSWTLADYVFRGNPYLDDNIVEADLLTPSVTSKGATGTLTATGGHTPFTSSHVGAFWKIGAPVGSPEVQGYVEITGFTSSTVVSITVIKDVPAGATDEWAEAAWSDERGWPGKVAYHKSKLWFFGSKAEPNGAWASKPFVFDDFDPGTGLDDEGIDSSIPDTAEIRWAIGGRSLQVGTNKGLYSANEDTALGLVPSNTSFNRQTSWPSEAIQPKIIGNYVYPIQEGGRKVREAFYFFDEDSYKSADVTALAEHITKGNIVDVAYQTNPYSMAYFVLGNGNMAIMTREADQQVLAWTEFKTNGTYESVGVIPHPTENYDIVGAIVKRNINGTDERHVEFFENPTIPDEQDKSFYVDDGLRFDAYTSNVGGTLTLAAQTGSAIEFTAGAAVFVAGDVGQRIRAIDIDTGEILGEAEIVTFTDTTHVDVDIIKDFDAASYVANAWGISVNTISGLDHLEDEVVKILVDGGTHADKTVASGDITLDDTEDGFVVAIGLGYTSRWKNMPMDAGSATGSARGSKKRIYKADFVLYRTLGIKVGGDEDNLNGLIFRDPATLMGQPEPFFTGTFAGAKINTTNEYEGHIVVEQTEPLPLCVLAIIPHVETYDV